MPIYEYRLVEGQRGCERCQGGIEVIQGIHDVPITACPRCGAPVDRILSTVSYQVRESGPTAVEKQIRAYEQEGRYSHAAELADKEAEKTKREDLKTRALDDYQKAGYRDL